MRFADVSTRLNDVSERYQVPERLNAASQKVREGVSAAGDAAYRGAYSAYEFARAHPRSSIGAAFAAAAIIGGVLWYLFATEGRPVQRRRSPSRARAGSERRRKHSRTQRAAAT
jgi:hypothetical protein